MKRIFSIISAVIIGCMTLSSCEKLDLDIIDIISGLINGDKEDEGEDEGDAEKLLFIIVNASEEDTYWYVPSKQYQNNMEAEFNEGFLHALTANDADFVTVTPDNGDPIWTYGPNDKMPIYVFKAEVIDNMEWKDIISHKLWSSMKYFTPKDVINCEYIIEYPF